MKFAYKHFSVVLKGPEKTGIYDVCSISGDSVGHIKWHGSRYCFFPKARTVFDGNRLKDLQVIVDF
jgi:hypothetical protein